ncbi:MAG: M42 family metallopeptidase [Chloroflexi bacterium]|nr:M42 family metallopeptidase [Chloroflexota bacterium]
MPFDVKKHLSALTQLPGPSGHEGPVREALRQDWAEYVDDFDSDGLGSLIATRHGTGPEPRRQVMLCTHMDAIGLIVAEIRDGFIRTSTLGGVDYRVLLAQPVIVHGKRELPGVFGAMPPHMSQYIKGSRKRYPDRYELWIDVGLPAGDVEELVQVGDIITFDAPFFDLKGERVCGPAFDNRASIAAVTVCLDELTRREHAWDVVAVASVQEEIGHNGAMASTYKVQPDIAITVDGAFGKQTGTKEDDVFTIGDGPTLAVGPNFHPLLNEALREAAQQIEMDLRDEMMPGSSGTDAWHIQISREGVPTALLGIPMKNMHTPVEVLDLRDVRRTGRLMAAFIAGLAPDFLNEIAWPLPESGAGKNTAGGDSA